jgi:RecB family exonuclease
VLLQWLDYELGRPDFIVEACEKEQTVKIDGLELHLRVDRIDRVDKGRLILDYKTGVASASMWEGERPDEPQLPLYGTHGGVEDLCGVLFAKIRAEEMHFVGSAKDPATTVYRNFSGRTKVKSNLTEDALRQWSETLRILAADFLTGNAAVEPKSYPKTCRFCPLPGLCRVAEVNVATEAEDDADDSAITGEETDNA